MRGAFLAAAIVTAVATAVLIPNAPAGRVPSEDAGVFFYAARALLRGGTPYLDVWDHKPPLVYVLDAVGLALAGVAGVFLVQVVALAAAGLLGLRAMARSFGLVPATFASVAWLLASPRLFLEDGKQTSYVEFSALPLQFATLAIVAARPDLRLGPRAALAVGALGALAFLLKPTVIALWIVLGIALLWRARAALLWAALGAAATVAPFAAFFALRGALGDLVEQAFRYNLAYASFAPLAQRLGAIPDGLRLTSPSGLAPLALAAFLLAFATRRDGVLLRVALVTLPLEMFLSTAGRAYSYYFLPWLPAMAVLAAFAAAELRARLDERRTLALLAVAVVLMAIQPTRLVTRLAAIGDDGSSRAAAAYLGERTRADETVLVWGSHTEVLVLADRRSPTRYVYQYAALATRGYATPAAVDAFLAALAANPPAVILDASIASFVTPPLDRAAMRTWSSSEAQYAWPPEAERIVEYVEANYVRDGTLTGPGWPLWRRR